VSKRVDTNIDVFPLAERQFVAAVDGSTPVVLTAGVILLKGFPYRTDDALARWICTLGRPLRDAANHHDGILHDVEVQGLGSRLHADTPYEFPLHTDCADLPHPPDLVILYCERQDPQGGASSFAHADEIVRCLSHDQIEPLSHADFTFAPGARYPILSFEGGPAAIRYNRLRFELYDPRPTTSRAALLDSVDRALDQVKVQFHVTEGQCLLIDNRHVLHGRDAFDPASRRSFKRAHVFTGMFQPPLMTTAKQPD
jgi:gamma-butyrobetaine dioxygenase